jgi:hypothetical protein
MTRHAPHAALLAYADGRLDAAAAAEIRALVEACPHCRRKLEDVRALGALAAEAAASDVPPKEELPMRLDAALDAALDDVVLRHVVVPNPSAPAADRRGAGGDRERGSAAPRSGVGVRIGVAVGVVAAFAAAVFVYRGLFVGDSDAGGPPPVVAAALELVGRAIVEPDRSAVRGVGDRTHLEVRATAATHLVVLRVAGAEVVAVYPDPNPLLWTYGRTEPFAAGETARIPPSPALDPFVADLPPGAAYVAVAVREAPTAAGVDEMLRTARGAHVAKRGAAAVVEALRVRGFTAVELR